MRQKLTSKDGASFFASKNIAETTVNDAYFMAMESMATLNSKAAVLMQKYQSHGATDVTGFGILGHARNLAEAQIGEVDLVIDRLPIFAGMAEHVVGMPDFKVTQGFSAETSGGILTMLEARKTKDFMSELEQEYGQKSWIVGSVVAGSRKARISADAEVVPVKDSFMLR